MPTRVNTDDLQNQAVTAAKLASDPSSLAQVTGNQMAVAENLIKLSLPTTHQDETDVFYTYENNVIRTVTYKNKAGTTLYTVTINRNATTLLPETVVENVGPTTITQTVNRDGNGRLISVTKTVT